MAYTTIDDSSAHFQIATYTGTSDDSAKVVTNDGNSDLQPDLAWIKATSGTYATRDHSLYDSSRGATLRIETSSTDAEATDSGNSFSSDGMTLAANYSINGPSTEYVGWQWKANGGSATASASESGDNPAYSTQANTTAGFSIVTYTGTGANGTVTHSLGGTPEAIIIKNRDRVDDWPSYWADAGTSPEDYAFKFNSTAVATAYDDNTAFNDTAPTSTVFSVGSANMTNADGEKIVAYCFRSIKGYSKIGTYTGNGNANGTFVYTGFQPRWLVIRPPTVVSNWFQLDTARDTYNPATKFLRLEGTNAADDGADKDIDFLSNGFKCRAATGFHNDNGETYMYMAFARHPFVTSKGIPCTAF